MSDSYMIDTNSVGNEDLYVFNKALFDIIQKRIVLIIKKPVVLQFLRRNERYSIGYNIFVISINPNLQVFKNFESNSGKIKYVTDNWKDFVRITLSKLYPNDLTYKMTEQLALNVNYQSLFPENNKEEVVDNLYAYTYFLNHYPELNYFYVYNGYTANEFVGYYKIPKNK